MPGAGAGRFRSGGALAGSRRATRCTDRRAAGEPLRTRGSWRPRPPAPRWRRERLPPPDTSAPDRVVPLPSAPCSPICRRAAPEATMRTRSYLVAGLRGPSVRSHPRPGPGPGAAVAVPPADDHEEDRAGDDLPEVTDPGSLLARHQWWGAERSIWTRSAYAA